MKRIVIRINYSRWKCWKCCWLEMSGGLAMVLWSVVVADLAGIPLTAVTVVVTVVVWTVAMFRWFRAVGRAHADGHPGKR